MSGRSCARGLYFFKFFLLTVPVGAWYIPAICYIPSRRVRGRVFRAGCRFITVGEIYVYSNRAVLRKSCVCKFPTGDRKPSEIARSQNNLMALSPNLLIARRFNGVGMWFLCDFTSVRRRPRTPAIRGNKLAANIIIYTYILYISRYIPNPRYIIAPMS